MTTAQITNISPGDTVEVKFSPAVSGNVSIGEVGRVTSDEIVINRRVYRWHEIERIEIVND